MAFGWSEMYVSVPAGVRAERESLRRDGFEVEPTCARAVRWRCDPRGLLRALRWFRLRAHYCHGRFSEHDVTAEAAVAAAVPALAHVPGERVWAELRQVFAAPHGLPEVLWLRARRAGCRASPS